MRGERDRDTDTDTERGGKGGERQRQRQRHRQRDGHWPEHAQQLYVIVLALSQIDWV